MKNNSLLDCSDLVDEATEKVKESIVIIPIVFLLKLIVDTAEAAWNKSKVDGNAELDTEPLRQKQNEAQIQKNAISKSIADLSSEENEMKRNIQSITSECAMLKSRILTNTNLEKENAE